MKKAETHTYKERYDEMILRDFLALDRTILAIKRTLLAYVRTFTGLIASGIGMVELVAELIPNIIGYTFIAAAFPILILGIIEYKKTRRALADIEKT